jgi:hypothetical protein
MEVWLVSRPDLRGSPAQSAVAEGLAEQLRTYVSVAVGEAA